MKNSGSRAIILGALSVALAACGSGHSASSSPVVLAQCPVGFSPDPAGIGCLDVTPTSDCAPGTRAAFGSATCQPVGWTAACPTGFEADASGWGCHEVLPSAACTGATYEHLGSTTCQPIGDCSAAFPPANATYFVNAAFTPAQTDATHFTTISAAVVAAPANAVVAVEAGTYTEYLNLGLPISIVGRCAEMVVLQSPGGEVAGVQALSVSGTVAVQGLTITGFRGGVVEQGGTMTVDDCLISASKDAGVVANGGSLQVSHSRIFGTIQDPEDPQGQTMGFGALVETSGSLVFSDVALVENITAGVAIFGPADAKLTQSVVLDTLVQPSTHLTGTGVAAVGAGTVEIAESAIVGNHNNGLELSGMGTAATVTGSVLRDTTADALGGNGNGVALDSGATATLESSAVAGNENLGLLVIDSGSKLTATNSVVRGTNASGTVAGMGAAASGGGALSLTNVVIAETIDSGFRVQDQGSTATVVQSLVRDTVRNAASQPGDGVGVVVAFGAKLDLTDSCLASNTIAGLVVGATGPTGAGGVANLSKVVVVSTQPDETGQFGRGLEAESGATLTVDSSAIINNYDTAISVEETGTSAAVTNSILRGTGMGTPTPFGYGFVVVNGAVGSLTGSFVRENLGVALAFQASSSRIDNVWVAQNQVGVYVADATLEEVDLQPTTLGSTEVAVSQTQFVDNATRISSQMLPIPPSPPGIQ